MMKNIEPYFTIWCDFMHTYHRIKKVDFLIIDIDGNMFLTNAEITFV